MRRALCAMLAAVALVAAADEEVRIAPFSSAQPGGDLPRGWRKITLPYGPASEFKLVRDGEQTVLQVRSDNSFGTAAYDLAVEPTQAPMLSWRWKIDRVVDKADMYKKDGEDFAARVYVSFDYPVEALPRGTRTKLKIARAIYGDVPAAAICYVWDNRHATGESLWSLHFDYVRIVVLQSGNARAGEWVEERRDVDADFRAAFGERWPKPTPKIAAVVAGSDTDQTDERATAWFGDFKLEPRR